MTEVKAAAKWRRGDAPTLPPGPFTISAEEMTQLGVAPAVQDAYQRVRFERGFMLNRWLEALQQHTMATVLVDLSFDEVRALLLAHDALDMPVRLCSIFDPSLFTLAVPFSVSCYLRVMTHSVPFC
jgi:hypothetical protein